MQTPIPLLQNVKVAKPCAAAWSAMESIDGDRVRHCDGCKKNVYNLSAMTQAEAEGLLRKHEGRLCVRYYQRRDGTVLTADCPVGVQAVRQMFLRRSVATAALFVLGLCAMAVTMNRTMNETMGSPMSPPQELKPLMGAVAAPTIPAVPQTVQPTEIKGQAVIEPGHTVGQAVMGLIAPPEPVMGKVKLMPEKYNSAPVEEPKASADKDKTEAPDKSLPDEQNNH